MNGVLVLMGMGMGGGYGLGKLRRGGTTTKIEKPWVGLKRLLPWIAPFWSTILIGIICMVISTFLDLQPIKLLGNDAIDGIIIGHNYAIINSLVIKLALVLTGTALFGFLRTYTLHVAGQRLLHMLRTRIYAHFQKLPLTFYDSQQTGDLMSRMTSDVEQVSQLVEHGPDVFLIGLFTMGLIFYYIWQINHHLALLTLVPIPVIAISIFFFGRAIRPVYRIVRDCVGALNARVQDNLSGIRVIKAFTREATEEKQVCSDSAAVMNMSIRGIRMWSSFGPGMGLVGGVGLILLLAVGIPLAQHGFLKAGQLAICWVYVLRFYQPIGTFFTFYDSIQRSLAAGDRIFEVLDHDPEIQDPENPLPLHSVIGEVIFDHVSFRYATGDEVLSDINLTARHGERIALVGRSGAGKTSFINLIPRFYDVVDGCVLVDGVDVRDVRQADLRRHIALVLQETFLFNGTVRENLRFGKMDASDDELLAAATAANAHEFIERLPNGYDTEIGERGVKLSGGQRQRLSIARAILANPRILILDEATSSVDSESEFLIHQALERLMEGRTTFIIAHRLSTIKHADTILVLEDGEIAERGNHKELLKANGHYAKMYRQQFWLNDLFKEEDDTPAPVRSAVQQHVDIPTIG